MHWACRTRDDSSHRAVAAQNVVLYSGNSDDRDMIEQTEFWRQPGDARRQGAMPKFNVLLASYEMVLKDVSVLKRFEFEAAVLDEAHRCVASSSQLCSSRAGCLGAHSTCVCRSLSAACRMRRTGTGMQRCPGTQGTGDL